MDGIHLGRRRKLWKLPKHRRDDVTNLVRVTNNIIPNTFCICRMSWQWLRVAENVLDILYVCLFWNPNNLTTGQKSIRKNYEKRREIWHSLVLGSQVYEAGSIHERTCCTDDLRPLSRPPCVGHIKSTNVDSCDTSDRAVNHDFYDNPVHMLSLRAMWKFREYSRPVGICGLIQWEAYGFDSFSIAVQSHMLQMDSQCV